MRFDHKPVPAFGRNGAEPRKARRLGGSELAAPQSPGNLTAAMGPSLGRLGDRK